VSLLLAILLLVQSASSADSLLRELKAADIVSITEQKYRGSFVH